MEADFVKNLGDISAVGIMFLAYWALHRSTFTLLQKMLESMNENFNATIQRQRDAEERNYEVLKGLTEDLKVLVANIGRIEMKIDDMKNHLDDRRHSK